MKNRLRELVNRYRDKCDYLEVRVEDTSSMGFSFSSREMSNISQNHQLGGAVRACFNGGWGFGSINSLDKLDQVIQQVISQAKKVGNSKTNLKEIEIIEKDFPLEIINDPRNIPLEEKVRNLEKYNEQMLSYHDIIKNTRIGYTESFKKKTLVTSEGSLLMQEGVDISCALSPIAMINGLSQFTYVTCGSSNDYNVILGLEKELESACKTAVELASASPVKGGKYPVILDTHLGGTFAHEAFGHFSEADDYMDNPQIKDIFPIGKKMGSEILSIYDTGLDIGTRGYVPFDDEGVPGSKAMLIENGILTGRLHNRESAAKFNEPVTGNARAKDYHYPPICRMRNTCIANGTSSFEELVDGIDLGVYAIQSIGGHGGEMFSFNALYGYMIRKGKIAELVRDVSISGNLFTTLMNIDKVGNDYTIEDSSGGCGKGSQFPLPVTSSSPHFRVKDATVGGV